MAVETEKMQLRNPGAEKSVSERVGKTPAKPRVSHYTQYTTRLHENSKVSLDDLEEVLASRAAEVGEELVTKTSGRQKGTIFIVGPKRKSTSNAEQRLAKLAAKFAATAAKAGVDPSTYFAGNGEVDSEAEVS